jgi:hypothetical protein
MTAHWIAHEKHTNTLRLRSELIAFHHMTGSHTGEAIAKTVLALLDRAGVAEKVSHFAAMLYMCLIKGK